MATSPLLIDSHEAGRLLKMVPSRVTRLAKRGNIPCVILPDGGFRFSAEDLRQWVEQHRQPVTKAEGSNE